MICYIEVPLKAGLTVFYSNLLTKMNKKVIIICKMFWPFRFGNCSKNRAGNQACEYWLSNRQLVSFMFIMSIRFKSTSSADLKEKFNFFLRRSYQTNYSFLDLVYVYGVLCHFQQYFSYIVVVVLLVKETRVPRENHRSVASHWQTWSDNVASSQPGHGRGSNSQLFKQL